MSSDKLQWHQEFVSTAVVGEEPIHYRVLAMDAEVGKRIVFQAIVKEPRSGARLLDGPFERMEDAFGRCEEDIDRRRDEHHMQTIEDRTAAFLRANGIRVTIAAERHEGLYELAPGAAAVLGELTKYKATLEGKGRKIEFPMWGEEVPGETVALLVAKEGGTPLPSFKNFCAEQKLEPGSAAAKTLWKQVQAFRREAGGFFTSVEREQLDRLVEPPTR